VKLGAMTLRLVPGTGNRQLATAIAARLRIEATPCEVARFPDGELRPSLAEVRGDDVYVVQPTGPPVNDHLVELLMVLDACRRAGADRVTAVVPYFGYARQDRRAAAGDAVGARVVADALSGAGADRLVVVDPHTVALEAMCDMPVEMLTAVPVLAAALRPIVVDDAVVIAPDLGAVKLAERYAALLGRAVAVVRKVRTGGETVEAHELVGDVDGRPVVVVDDMISTGATIEAAAGIVRAHGGNGDVVVAATHGLFTGRASDALRALGLRHLLITDTLPSPPHLTVEQCSVAELLAAAIGRLHRDQPLGDLLFPV
jgi:ribose-phosphate pyrophosphokinase